MPDKLTQLRSWMKIQLSVNSTSKFSFKIEGYGFFFNRFLAKFKVLER